MSIFFFFFSYRVPISKQTLKKWEFLTLVYKLIYNTPTYRIGTYPIELNEGHTCRDMKVYKNMKNFLLKFPYYFTLYLIFPSLLNTFHTYPILNKEMGGKITNLGMTYKLMKKDK